MKYLLAGLMLCLCSASALSAQDLIAPVSKLSVKTGLLNLIDPFVPSANIMAEYRLSPHFTVQGEFGVLLPASAGRFIEVQSMRGIRLRPAVRYYTEKSGYSSFFELLGLRRNAYLTARSTFQVQPLQGGSFNQLVTFRGRYRKSGLFLNVGSRNRLGKNWFVEFASGLGVIYRTEHYLDIPIGAEFVDESFLARSFWAPVEPLSEVLPSFMFYVNVGYNLIR